MSTKKGFVTTLKKLYRQIANPGILLAFKKANQIVKRDPIGISHSKGILSGILWREN